MGTVIYPMFFQYFDLLVGGLILVQIYVCSDVSLFSSY
jgi:hypothetical protein